MEYLLFIMDRINLLSPHPSIDWLPKWKAEVLPQELLLAWMKGWSTTSDWEFGNRYSPSTIP